MKEDQLKQLIVEVIERDNVLKDYLKQKCFQFIRLIDNSKDDTMYKKQAETILKLQDQLRLSTFDVAETHKELRLAKERYNIARRTIAKTKEELVSMKRKGDYKDIDITIARLRDVGEENDIN